MALDTTQRQRAAKRFALHTFRDLGQTAVLSSDQIVAAIGALDDAMGNVPADSSVSIAQNLNQALPANVRTTATPTQKLLLLAFVLVERTGALG